MPIQYDFLPKIYYPKILIEDDIVLESDMSSDLIIDKYPSHYDLRDKYYPIIEKNLPKNEDRLMKYIGNYIDKYFQILSSPYPVKYPIFTFYPGEDEKILLDVCGIDKQEITKDFINAQKNIPKKINQPTSNYAAVPIIMLLMMRYYILNKKPNQIKALYYYFAYSKYWLVHVKIFQFPIRESTMIYTINNMSNKFKIKQLKSVNALLYNSTESVLTAPRNIYKIEDAANKYICYVSDLVFVSIRNSISSIAEVYLKNYYDKKVILSSKELIDDNEGGIRDLNTDIGNIEQYAQEMTTKFFSSRPNISLLKQVRTARCSDAELRAAIEHMIDKQAIYEVQDFYRAIFQLYFTDKVDSNSSRSVHSIEFPATMDAIYKKGNSNDKNIIRIKELMNKWLTEGSMIYKSNTRPGTLNEFKKALFQYMTWSVSWKS